MSEQTQTAPAVAPAAMNDAAARQAERDRVAAILNHQEAQGREAMARHLAFSTTMSAEEAAALLAAAPKTVPQQPAASSPFTAAMAGVANPNVGTAASASAADEDKQLIARMVGYGNRLAANLNREEEV